jgi:delta 1-pyrroline-5-carboxylate dehydrogenase
MDGTTNLALRARASAFEFQPGLPPELANDGKMETRWSGIPGHNTGAWYELDWDAPVRVGQVVIIQYDRYVKEMDVQLWDDGAKIWVTVQHFGTPDKRLPKVVVCRFPPRSTTRLRLANITNGPSFNEVQVFEEAGVPPGVLNFLSGHGSVIGAHLVDHKDVDLIAFTGSREVGLKIWESAGITCPGQRELKRVICEMGGKNAMIVDADADLDETIMYSIYSAFGFQGQKCSALSCLILLEEKYDRVMERLIPAAASLRIGNPEQPGIMVGPVIDEPAYRRILEYIEIGKKEATLAYQAKEVPPQGYFIPPTIFTDVKPNMRIAREEIFGPVLSVLKVRDLDEALEVANGTDYALTGGFFSRSPDNIERIKARLEAGNVYINRSCTGAIVGRHPFGGFKMSGSGTKAGGEDYLLNFLVPRVVIENTSRHGFAPEQSPEYRDEFLWPKPRQ